MRRLWVVLGTVMVAALTAGCGGSTNPSNDTAQARQTSEVRKAMEATGNYLFGRDALRQAGRAQKEARQCVSLKKVRCAETAIDREEAAIEKSERLRNLVNFSDFKKSTLEEVRRKIEDLGLVGNGCSEDREGAWHC